MTPKFNAQLVDAVWQKTAGHCWYCGDPVVPFRGQRGLPEPGYAWGIAEHTTPRLKGGSNRLENLVPACLICNGRKSNRTIEEYRLAITLATNGAPKFTQQQLQWLANNGVVLPVFERYLFWFERQPSLLAYTVGG